MQCDTRFVTTRGLRCALHCWVPAEPIGVAVVFHGLGAHGRFPTVVFAAELLAEAGFAVYAMDLPGHGASEGIRGFIASDADLLTDGTAAVAAAMAASGALPLILVGSSMGGAIALNVSSRLTTRPAGVILLAPMLALSTPWHLRLILAVTASVCPQLPLIKSKATSSVAQYADASRRAMCDSDKLSYSGKLRPGSAHACISLTERTAAMMGQFDVPFLCLVAGRDSVVDNRGVDLLEELAATPAALRTVRRFPTALHGLLCEAEPLRSAIETEIVSWATDRASAAHVERTCERSG